MQRDFRLALKIGSGNYDGSLQELRERLASDPNNPGTLLALALGSLLNGDPQGAEAFANRLLELNPTSFDALEILTNLSYDRNDHDRAAEFARRAISVHFLERPRKPWFEPVAKFARDLLLRQPAVGPTWFRLIWGVIWKTSASQTRDWIDWASKFVAQYDEENPSSAKAELSVEIMAKGPKNVALEIGPEEKCETPHEGK